MRTVQQHVLIIVGLALIAAAPVPLHWSAWTSPALTAAIKAGTVRTVIIPTGGIEDNGPDLPLDKHNHIVAKTADMLAQRLGAAVVAPVVVHVPEADHAGATGTLSVSGATFEAILSDTITSLARTGVREIVLMGDSGGNQAPQARVAQRLDAQLKRHGVRVWHLGDYYARNGQGAWLAKRGIDASEATRHAGVADHAEYAAATGGGDAKMRSLGAGLLTLKVLAAQAEIERLRQNR
jgi:creatinine amidohydrolase/Fe(II)-dependent formamide hydrolase-like protein